MAFFGSISDRLGIRELIETYNDAVNQRDTDSWAATWIQAGVWNLMVQKFEGRNKLTQVWVSAMETYSHVFFTAYPGTRLQYSTSNINKPRLSYAYNRCWNN